MSTLLMRNGGVAVLLDVSGHGLPRVLHWGADVPGVDAAEIDATWFTPSSPHSAFDSPWPFTLSPTSSDGWSGRPGLSAALYGAGSDAAPVFPRWVLTGDTEQSPATQTLDDGTQVFTVTARDVGLGSVGGSGVGGSGLGGVGTDWVGQGLELTSRMLLHPSGLLRMQHSLSLPESAAGEVRVGVRELLAVLPLPERAGEVLDLTGRWCRERSPQRLAVGFGSWVRETRRGRTGHDGPTLMACGTKGFGFRTGEVWAVHAGWSGDQVHYVERLSEGAGWHGGPVLGAGEMLRDGEIMLAPGQSYTTPWTFFAYGEAGLDSASGRIHEWMRARPTHPDPVSRPRPVVLNTWEAVYFDHDLERLTELAQVAADVGVERFVLDDGWFGARRGDKAGLGDWLISEEVWPEGTLRELADRVRALGMDFGIWFEPEMVNLDSDLVREHPEWLLGPAAPAAGRSWRHQYVLNLALAEVFDLLAQRISDVVDHLGVAYIKWDHNRDLHEMAAHAQTDAFYRLLDVLRERHPELEIESCASGGARVDLGVLQHTDRVWASDTNDALERQQIQRFTTVLLPPELVGSHLGGQRSHTTARLIDQPMRAITALFAHAGIEWDITRCSAEELELVRAWVSLYKELRPLLHSGTVVRADLPSATPDEPETLLHGVVSADASHAVFSYVRMRTAISVHPGRLRFPGLDPERTYRVPRREEAGKPAEAAIAQPQWWATGDVEVPGAVLTGIGLPAPMIHPAQAVLVEAIAIS